MALRRWGSFVWRQRRVAAVGGGIIVLLSSSRMLAPPTPALSFDDPATAPAVIRRKQMEDVFILAGEARAVQARELVTPRSEGWRTRIQWLAEDGAEVQAGDPVVEFDNSQTAQELGERQLELVKAEVELHKRRATLAAEGAQKRFELEQATIEVEKARIDAAVPRELRSRLDWHEMQKSLGRAQAQLAKARLALETFDLSSRAELEMLGIARRKAVAELKRVRHSLDSLTLEAPAAGIVVVADNRREGRKYQVGDSAYPGWTIAAIPDLSEMEVVASLHPVDEGRIAEGLPARCILDTYPDDVFVGRVAEIAGVAGEGVGAGYRVRVRLAQTDPERIKPGMSVRVEVVRRVWESALVLPRRAVVPAGRGFSLAPSFAARNTAVKIDACNAVECVVSSGLEEGQRVARY